MACLNKLHLISGRLKLRVVCSWLSNGILIALESWHTLCCFFFLDLKQGCKVSQSQHYSAEVSLPQNWVNEKPNSLIELNTHAYADSLPSLPPTIYSAFIFLCPPHRSVFCFFFLTIMWSLVMKAPQFKCLKCGRVKRAQWASSRNELGRRDLQFTSLIIWLKQLMSMSTMRTNWKAVFVEFSVNSSLSIITSLWLVCLRQTF